MKFENPDKISEDILFIRQTLLGNKAAFEKLVLKYRPAIYALALSYAKNAADAEDLTQEVFIKAYQNLACLKNLEQFPFWLRQITRNHCKNWLKRREERHVSFEEVKVAEATNMASSPEEMALKQELREIVWQAIDSLLEIDRKLMKAHYLEDVSLKQLQVDYGLSYCAIAGRLKRAKQKVRETVQKALMGFCALPGREILEKLFLGGIEAVKLSLKTKLVTVATVAVLGLGGAGVWLWHSNEASQKSSGVQQQKVKGGKAASALATSQVQSSKPTLKVAQKQPAKSSQSDPEKNISDKEWAKFEKWLAELEQSDEQPAEETDLSQSKQDETASPALSEEAKAKYQALREVFVRMNEIWKEEETVQERFKVAGKEWESVYKSLPPPDEVPPAEKKAIKMKALKYLEEQYAFLKNVSDLDEKWIATREQIDRIFPGALVTREAEPWPSGKPRTEYSINREYIESMIGKMPADVETAFLPHVRSRTLSMLTPSNVRLENCNNYVQFFPGSPAFQSKEKYSSPLIQ